MRSFSLNKEKMKDAVNFVVKSSDPSTLGQTKLHKVLYFSEMLSYLDSGEPIFGASYKKRPYGPTCDALLSVLPEMEREGRISISTESYFGHVKKVFENKDTSNGCLLNANELSILADVTNWVCKNHTARSISEFSHNIVWDMVEFGENIPYHLAVFLFPEEPSQEALEIGEQLWVQCEDKTPGSSTELEGSVAAAIRSRLH